MLLEDDGVLMTELPATPITNASQAMRPQLSYFKAHGPPFPRKRISTCQILRGFARRHFAKHLKPFMNAETRPVDLPSEFKKLHFTVRTDVMVQETKSLIKYFATPKGLSQYPAA
ncbi:hypothetical protein AnigIFM59636_004420 [Aspergillus niger]|uniref:Acyl-CoA dehydrogenase, C-terminal domain family protein n=3 Tax=Aspergillus niger TaxID=5061 RepID=A0A505I463_ASPNG|nr:hypothetical protein M747DRAFT_342834 [Aspergillus niger ATCC 13496]TPR06768.1 Acyl-CoA dehydrogenase, C-terminal domain family protein [Aspergillus niger]GJP93100.1 acyl-CoA dehydrogenase, C-terminal domain family protein [Aspergillus niger]GKZ91765.1 hypothetical protein AnigIFM59636_004420 [Aspergillus niger]